MLRFPFPSQMLKPIHQNPVVARVHCFPRLLTASCLLNQCCLVSGMRYELPTPAMSVSWGDVGVFSPPVTPKSCSRPLSCLASQGRLCPGLIPVLPAALTSCQRYILTALAWKSVLYTVLRLFKDNP